MRAWRGGLLAVMTVLAVVAGTSPATAERPTPRIVGGQDSAIEQVPYQVALITPGAGSDHDGQFCGGSILGPLWVVTAAHCVVTQPNLLKRPEDVLVLAGKSTLSTSREGSGPYTAVARIIVHPDYDPQAGTSDVALLRLSTALPINGTTIAAISLPSAQDRNTWPAAGSSALISGWGKMRFSDGVGAVQLQTTDITVLAGPTQDACGSYTGEYQKALMVCAGLLVGGRDTCQGDSGGPLRVMVGDRPVLAGITSSGASECAKPNTPGLYTRVTTFADWITGYLSSSGGLTISPSGLDFGAPVVGTVTPTQNVTVSNSGSTPVPVAASLAGTDAGEFTLASACPAELAAGASCTLGVAFAPIAGGAKSATLRIDPDGVQIYVTGAGTTVTVLPSQTVPARPSGLAAKAGKRKIRASWDAVPSATSYTVTLRGRPAKGKKRFTTTSRTASPKVTFRKALRAKSRLRLCVSATNEVGTSPSVCLTAKRR